MISSYKKKLIKLITISLLVIGVASLFLIIIGIGIAIADPFQPGNVFFPIQYFDEQQMLFLVKETSLKNTYILDLLERRIDDVVIRTGTPYETISLEYFNKTLDQTLEEIPSSSKEASNQQQLRLFSLFVRMNNVLNQLTVVPEENSNIYQETRARILVLLQLADNAPAYNDSGINITVSGNSNGAITELTSISGIHQYNGLIPFPPGSIGAVHAFYPLEGQHALLNCEDCHSKGSYSGTANTCILCHLEKQPDPHFIGECELCHTAIGWDDIHFDHINAQLYDCLDCHSKDVPADHYLGPCSACHVVEAWNIVTFDHDVAMAVDCVSCHEDKTPSNHYPGQCSNCHNTSDWRSVNFDHSGFNNCDSCHADKKPANHYAGQCSNCHNTSNWASISFDHSGFTDCVSCHSADAPGNHYDGQCSRCHSTDTWQGAQFNHEGLTDCISCHAVDAPGGHYPGQCSNCHDTGGSWANAQFNHSGYTDCISCHSDSAPNNHFPGQCGNCHSTDSWSGATFNHDGYTDCISCHEGDRPAEHDQGQCSECHNTQSWGDAGDSSGDGLNMVIITGIQFPAVSCQSCHPSSATNLIKGNSQ